ncbi:PACE efflux transporter [Albidovulum sp.]|uniref:PACE efflux transporter n=1 Tax=Albidovulum sp. TaxID=1872424 RepID=UPI001D50FDFD|nr:PACE efflux transporter [Paracoccaceae bacterium]MCO5128609.1 PACE efflux transporter [Paracoccaceae bacterium]MCP5356167.1 PACE efflux transporter [Paracoccaceae bacterium]MCP5377084.1 PACE efflux transporter [Paracoccaceae bacterium]HPE26481.1 PACE efflux transporter [Albidovulum sp.]
MRSRADRIRHAVAFELIGLFLITPLGAWVMEMPMHAIGLVALVGSLIATAWNYGYNLVFDRALLRLTGRIAKSQPVRALHAVLFEGGLVLILVPYLAWQLGIPLWQALMMDLGFVGFYLVYAYAFNWAYDTVFPPPGG